MARRYWLFAYDISDPRRWRRVHRTLRRRGAWQQLSVFVCRLNAEAARRLEAELAGMIDPDRDRLVMVDLGEAPDERITRHGKGSPLPAPRLLIL
jgi:CRISPR-associated protein Cas2